MSMYIVKQIAVFKHSRTYSNNKQ